MKNNERPKVVVGVLIYNKKEEIFLTRSHQWNNTWVIPGGSLEYKESFEECARREVKEETNLSITKLEFIGIQEAISPREYEKHRHLVLLDFCAQARSEIAKLNHEAEEYAWISPRKALKLNLGSFTRILVKRFIQQKHH